LFQGKVDLDLLLLSLMSSLEYTWGSFVVNLLLLACFLIFKQFRGSGWLQREFSLIQGSNLILNRRWLIHNLDLIWHCFPFRLLLRRSNSDAPYTWLIEMSCPPLGYFRFLRPRTSNSLHCGGLFLCRGSTRVTYSWSPVQARKYSLFYNPTLNSKNHTIQ
jgi:hypothetical protein